MGDGHASRLCILAVIGILFGCKDKNAATAENFERALQIYYDAHSTCITLPITFPIARDSTTNGQIRHQIEGLIGAGLVARSPFPDGSNDIRFVVTAEGQRDLRSPRDSFLGGTDLCFARRHVTGIASFSQPADMMGLKVSQVTYSYEFKDIAPWAKKSPIRQTFPQIAAMLAQPSNTAMEGLVLTDHGWVDEHQIH